MLGEADVSAADVAKALLLRFDDNSEQCRELAINMLLAQLQVCRCAHVWCQGERVSSCVKGLTAQRAPALKAGLLPYLTAVLEERLLSKTQAGVHA